MRGIYWGRTLNIQPKAFASTLNILQKMTDNLNKVNTRNIFSIGGRMHTTNLRKYFEQVQEIKDLQTSFMINKEYHT